MKMEEICKVARDMFLQFGIKSVSMDDISRAMGISKKTLYQVIPNKQGLIDCVLDNYLCEEKDYIATIKRHADNPVHEMVLIAQHMSAMLRKISPTAIYDLKKYYHGHWKKMDASRTEIILRDIRQNLNDGMEQELYRSDLDIDLVSALYLRMATFITDERSPTQEKTQSSSLYSAFIKYHIRGIATPSGIELLEHYTYLLKDA